MHSWASVALRSVRRFVALSALTAVLVTSEGDSSSVASSSPVSDNNGISNKGSESSRPDSSRPSSGPESNGLDSNIPYSSSGHRSARSSGSGSGRAEPGGSNTSGSNTSGWIASSQAAGLDNRSVVFNVSIIPGTTEPQLKDGVASVVSTTADAVDVREFNGHVPDPNAVFAFNNEDTAAGPGATAAVLSERFLDLPSASLHDAGISKVLSATPDNQQARTDPPTKESSSVPDAWVFIVAAIGIAVLSVATVTAVVCLCRTRRKEAGPTFERYMAVVRHRKRRVDNADTFDVGPQQAQPPGPALEVPQPAPAVLFAEPPSMEYEEMAAVGHIRTMTPTTTLTMTNSDQHSLPATASGEVF